MPDRHGHPGPQLSVDPVACDGIGICAHLAPSVVRVDSWGYPILSGKTVHGRDERQARAAVSACPRKALFISYG